MKYIFIPLLLLCSYISTAQLSNTEKIAQVYGETAASMSTEQLNWVNNCLSRCEVIASESSVSTVKDIADVPLNNKYTSVVADANYDAATFNPLKYRFDFFKKEDQYFRLFDSGKILKIKGKE